MLPVELSVEDAKKRFEDWFAETSSNYISDFSLKKTRYYDNGDFPQYFIKTKHKGYRGCFIWLTRRANLYSNWYKIEKALTRKAEEGYFVIRDSDYSELITKVDEFLDDSNSSNMYGMR